MELHMTDQALSVIGNKLANQGLLTLVSDHEGCGCADNGVPSLQLLDDLGPYDQLIASNAPFPVCMNRYHMVYFDEVMRLALQDNGYFRLSSDQQIFSTHVSFIDKRAHK